MQEVGKCIHMKVHLYSFLLFAVLHAMQRTTCAVHAEFLNESSFSLCALLKQICFALYDISNEENDVNDYLTPLCDQSCCHLLFQRSPCKLNMASVNYRH